MHIPTHGGHVCVLTKVNNAGHQSSARRQDGPYATAREGNGHFGHGRQRRPKPGLGPGTGPRSREGGFEVGVGNKMSSG